MWPAMRFWVQMGYLVEIEVLIFSDAYMFLKYACEILVQYLERFTEIKAKVLDPYIMEFYIKCFDVNANFHKNAGNSLLSTWLVRFEMSSPKSISKISGLRHDKKWVALPIKNNY